MKRTRRLVRHPPTLETWTRPNLCDSAALREAIRAAGLIVEGLCYVALGAGLALILQALHGAGWTP